MQIYDAPGGYVYKQKGVTDITKILVTPTVYLADGGNITEWELITEQAASAIRAEQEAYWQAEEAERERKEQEKVEHQGEVEQALQRVEALKAELAATDYVSCKIAEGVATVEEYASVINRRQEVRAEINELEELIKKYS